MNREQFESGYAERSGLSVEHLRNLGMHAIPCDCDEPECRGWQMSHETRVCPICEQPLDNAVSPWDRERDLGSGVHGSCASAESEYGGGITGMS